MLKKVVLALLGTAAVFPALPAARAEDTFNVPCAQAVRLGAEKFVNVYGKKSGGSEADYDAAAGYYYRCRRERNDLLAKKLPAGERSQVNRVREELKYLVDASTGLEYTAMGGGTMYGHMESREYAFREDLVGKVIQWMLDPPGMSAGSRAAGESGWTGAQRHLANLKTVPNFLDLHGAQYTAYRKEYLANLAAMNLHWNRLKTLVHVLPENKGAGLVASRMSEIVTDTYSTIRTT